MSTNTIKHISDLSQYKDFEPVGTNFPPNITNVQNALAMLSVDAVNGVPQATDVIVGKARFSTEQEVSDGISTDTMVSPFTLNLRLQRPQATETEFGVTRYATGEEAIEGTANDRSIVASSLKLVIDHTFTTRTATELANGVAKLSTTPAALAGLDDTTIMTPLKVKLAINSATSQLPTYGDATTQDRGLVRIATGAQGYEGSLRDGWAISPQTLAGMPSVEDKRGLIKIATQVEMNSATDNSSAVTPLKFASTRATTARAGTVMLTDTINGDASYALSGAAALISSNGNSVTTGAIYETSISPNKKYMNRDDLSKFIPVGFMSMVAFNQDSGNMYICNGRLLNISEYPELFRNIGTLYGGDGVTTFALPDMRGVFARGFDGGRGLDAGRVFGSYQDDSMQQITAWWTMDDQAVESNWRPGGACYADSKGSVNYDAGSTPKDWRAYRMHFDSARQTRVSNQTRPKNLAVNYVICVK